MYLTFDTETTGLPKNYSAPISDFDNWPRMVQIAWQVNNKNGGLISSQVHIIKPENFTIPYNSEQIHGISTEKAIKEGEKLETILNKINKDLKVYKYIIAHNINFDIKILGAEFLRCNIETNLSE